jgi:glycosyltransferase involved in cell wall biosynthesis
MENRITLILCARNEEGNITQIIESSRSHADEILVIDGHSTDRTAELARASGVSVFTDHGKGKGDAYKVGLTHATHDVVVFMDCDGSHEPADIHRIAAPILNDTADFVVASRHKGGSDEWKGDLDTWLRAIGSGLLSVIINARWKAHLTDVLNGFRAGRKSRIAAVPLRANDFDIEQHMVVQYLKAGLRVVEVASHEYERSWGVSKLPTLRKAYLFFGRLFLDLIRIRP